MYPEAVLPRKKLSPPCINSDSVFIRMADPIALEELNENGVFNPGVVDILLRPNGPIEVYSLSLHFDTGLDPKVFNYRVNDKSLFSAWNGEEELSPERISFCMIDMIPFFLEGRELVGRTTIDDISYSINVFHSPTRCNYWHWCYEHF